MDAMIRDLNDARAIRVLATIVEARLRASDAGQVELTPELARDLATNFNLTADPDSSISEGDLAREALAVLADDPADREAVTALIRGPVPERFGVDPVTTTVLITFAMIALKTHVLFERDKQGHWRFKIEKRAEDDGLVKPLVQKLLDLFSRR